MDSFCSIYHPTELAIQVYFFCKVACWKFVQYLDVSIVGFTTVVWQDYTCVLNGCVLVKSNFTLKEVFLSLILCLCILYICYAMSRVPTELGKSGKAFEY